MDNIAKVKGIQHHSDSEVLITLEVKEDKKTIMNILWYISHEEARSVGVIGQEFRVTMEPAGKQITPRRSARYERIARDSGNLETLKDVLVRKEEEKC